MCVYYRILGDVYQQQREYVISTSCFARILRSKACARPFSTFNRSSCDRRVVPGERAALVSKRSIACSTFDAASFSTVENKNDDHEKNRADASESFRNRI